MVILSSNIFSFKVSILNCHLMAGQSINFVLDIETFSICPFCLRVVPIIIVEAYLLILFAKELIKTKRYYDKLDRTIYFFSIICLANDLISILLLEVAVSSLSHILRVLWVLPLFLVFLRFIFEYYQCSKVFLISLLSLMFYLFVSIMFFGIVPIRYTLLILYVAIGICAFHQIISIR